MGLFPWVASWCLLAPAHFLSRLVWSAPRPTAGPHATRLTGRLKKSYGGSGEGRGQQNRRPHTERAIHEVTCGHFPEN